jgi:inner membrane protein
LLDLFTSYGTMIFAPFSDHRYAWDLTFIVDLIFSGILFIPWIVSLLWKKRAAWICRGSLVLLTGYILFCAVQHHRAINLTERFAGNLNEEVVQVASLPQPLSPFRWANYVETQENVYQGFVDFLADESLPPQNQRKEINFEGSGFFGRFRRWRLMEGLYQAASSVRYSTYQKNDGSPWVKRAMATEGVKFYYWFARFPVAKLVSSNNGTHRVEFTDVRFFIPGIRLPFSYYVELDDAGSVLREGFVRNEKRG